MTEDLRSYIGNDSDFLYWFF